MLFGCGKMVGCIPPFAVQRLTVKKSFGARPVLESACTLADWKGFDQIAS
jgi:hypothetical protein